MTKPSPTSAQMGNWLDAYVKKLANGDKESEKSYAFKCGVLSSRLLACIDDPKRIDETRAEILSFPEERV